MHCLGCDRTGVLLKDGDWLEFGAWRCYDCFPKGESNDSDDGNSLELSRDEWHKAISLMYMGLVRLNETATDDIVMDRKETIEAVEEQFYGGN